jgi:leucyl/phenylalanyl-tRNA---protein transferase
MPSSSPLPPSNFFPPAEEADEEGLIGFGGQLTPDWLLDAYRHGIFPWPISDFDGPVAWWSPDPRAVLEYDHFHVSRRLRRTCRGSKFEVTRDVDFPGVIRGCAMAPGRLNNTWLTPEMIDAYIELHRAGHAHSVEVWHQHELAGGVYGVAIGGLFAAESKFYRVRDASKVALVHLVEHLKQQGYVLIDIQMTTPHTLRLGATTISRGDFLTRLAAAVDLPVEFSE